MRQVHIELKKSTGGYQLTCADPKFAAKILTEQDLGCAVKKLQCAIEAYEHKAYVLDMEHTTKFSDLFGILGGTITFKEARGVAPDKETAGASSFETHSTA